MTQTDPLPTTEAPRPTSTPQVASACLLTPLETAALGGHLQADGGEAMTAHATLWAAQLTDPPTRTEARVALLARMAAGLRARIGLYETVRQTLLCAKDYLAARELQRAIDHDTRNLLVCLRELRAEDDHATGRVVRVQAVAIGVQPTVNVVAGPGR